MRFEAFPSQQPKENRSCSQQQLTLSSQKWLLKELKIYWLDSTYSGQPGKKTKLRNVQMGINLDESY